MLPLAAIALAAALGLYVYYFYYEQQMTPAPAPVAVEETLEAERPWVPPKTQTQNADPIPEVARAEAEAAPPEKLPPLDASDPWVRVEAATLSAHPSWSLWLSGEDLVRRVIAVVDRAAEGASLRPHLGFLMPTKRFRVVTREGRSLIDPRSFSRFDPVAELASSLDAERWVRLYRRGLPLLEQAFRELGYGDVSFSERLSTAVQRLLRTPLPTGREELVQPSVYWQYRDQALESLAPAQKELMRMGPANVRLIQAKLREIAVLLGIPTPETPRAS